MKYILTLSFIFAHIISALAQNYSKEDLLTVRYEGDSINGHRVGIWKEYYKNNVLKSVSEYATTTEVKVVFQDPEQLIVSQQIDTNEIKNNALANYFFLKGDFIAYYPNGKILQKCFYKPIYICKPSGSLDPENDRLVIIYNYPSSCLHGKLFAYYSNGVLQEETEYSNGKLVWYKYYNTEGILDAEGTE